MSASRNPAAKVAIASAVAVAVCAFSLAAEPAQADGMTLLQVTPAGYFTPSDGREMDVAAWHIDATGAQRVIERFRASKLPPVIDYEHQTLHKEKNGQPAPAAGWIRDLRWIEGRGLFAAAELTSRAKGEIDDKQYLYFSPVFAYHEDTGEVMAILMGAFTNNPAIHGMDAMSLTAAATAAFVPSTPQENPVNPLLKALLASLGLPETTTEANAITALTALGPLTDVATARAQATAARKALQLGDDATGDAVVAACTSLRTASAATPDPSKYVPIGVVEDLRTNVAALTSRIQQTDIDKVVGDALASGKLQPAMEAWARDLGKTNMAALTGFIEKSQPIAALSGTQTQGKQPDPKDGAHGLTAEEIKIAAATGLTPEQFAKAKVA
ncbi:phage protease [Variovorax sp.]|uniref:phage protease n=1 Tax=Variovorax sp. TaxID=1871043 RepID=UPI003BAD161A